MGRPLLGPTEKEKDWVVQVYRKSLKDGWSRMVPLRKTLTSLAAADREHRRGDKHNGGNSVHAVVDPRRISSSSRNRQPILTRVVAREGYMIIPCVKARIFISQQHESRTDGNAQGECARSPSFFPIQRRRNAILVRGSTSQSGSKTLVLTFRSEKECIEFSDHLQALNPITNLLAETTPHHQWDEAANNCHTTLYPIYNDFSGGGGDRSNSNSSSEIQNRKALSEEAVHAQDYMMQLLTNSSFIDFTRRLEGTIAASSQLKATLDQVVAAPT